MLITSMKTVNVAETLRNYFRAVPELSEQAERRARALAHLFEDDSLPEMQLNVKCEPLRWLMCDVEITRQ